MGRRPPTRWPRCCPPYAAAWRGCWSSPGESGWLRYVDPSGRGLANQGWKDSVDAVQFADGRLAEAPIALCEVQGYAYEAAVRGAALLAAFGERRWTGWRTGRPTLREPLPGGVLGGHPEAGHVAIALDGAGAPVDAVASNMGHLLGTGLLTRRRRAGWPRC